MKKILNDLVAHVMLCEEGHPIDDDHDWLKKYPRETNAAILAIENHVVEKLIKVLHKRSDLKYISSFNCDSPKSCGNGALCNSCWAREWAKSRLAKLQKGKI